MLNHGVLFCALLVILVCYWALSSAYYLETIFAQEMELLLTITFCIFLDSLVMLVCLFFIFLLLTKFEMIDSILNHVGSSLNYVCK